MLEAWSITKNYQGVAVIEDVSITVADKETVGLIGRSGVGKSTLFHVLSGISKPDAGQVLVDGADVTGSPGKVGYMQQKDLLLPYKTIADNIALPLMLRGVRKNEARARVLKLLPEYGLEGTGQKYPSQLSGGMRQRAALLRTWMIKTGNLLLDEPFSALDSFTRRQMQDWYMSICAASDTSTLLITHDIDEAILMCDRVYVMSGSPGRITFELPTPAVRPRAPDYITTSEFIEYKKMIASKLGQ